MQTPRQRLMTLIELITAVAIMSVIMAALVPLALFVIRSVDEASTIAALESDVLQVKERLKKDLLTTSRGLVIMYPSPSEGTEGFSMPVLQRPLNESSLPLDSSDGIAWNRTVIYHVFANRETGTLELRRTVFSPRDNSLTPEDRLEQLKATIAAGDGSHNIFGEAWTGTHTLCDNMTAYAISAGLANTDAYSPTRERTLFQLGTWVLQPGANDFIFRIIGKNTRSTGYDLCLDLLSTSATGKPLDAEALLPPLLAAAGTAEARDLSARSAWSNNSGLYFAAAGTQSFLKLSVYNDTWVESSFTEDGALAEGTEVAFDPGLGENILQLFGFCTSWEARIQTQDELPEASKTGFAGNTVLVLVSNVDAVTGGNLMAVGSAGKIRFSALPGQTLELAEAYVMERTSGFSGDPATVRQLTFYDAAAAGLATVWNDGKSVYFTGGIIESDLFDLPVSPNKDYLISFRFGSGTTSAAVPVWEDPLNNATHAAFVPATSGNWAGTASWDSSPTGMTILNWIPAAHSIFVTYPAEAVYTSAILDTRQVSPAYKNLDWRAETPTGTAVKVRIRAGSDPQLSDAPAWIYAREIDASGLPASIGDLKGRYLQWQAVLTSTAPSLETPKLCDVTVRWLGEKRGCDLAVIADKGPDMGTFELEVNGKGPAPATLELNFTMATNWRGQLFERSFSIRSFPQNRF